MDQAELIDKVQEKILDNLPDEAIQRLAELEDTGGNYDAAVQTILKENHIDVQKTISSVMEEQNEK